MTELQRIVGTALIVGIALGCTGTPADNRAGDEQPRHQVVECREVILVAPEPGPGYTAHGADGGFIALPSGAMQQGRSGPDGSGYEDYRFSKFGLLVRRSRQASLEIVSAPGNAFLDYGQGEFGSAQALTAGPCDPLGPGCAVDVAERLGEWSCGDDSGEWAVWAGGIWADQPGCVDVLVSSDGEQFPTQLAVAASCG